MVGRSASVNALGIAAVAAATFVLAPVAANAMSGSATHCRSTTFYRQDQCLMHFGRPRVAAGHVQHYSTGRMFTPGETIGGILHCRAARAGNLYQFVPRGIAGRHGRVSGVFRVPPRARRECTLDERGRSSGVHVVGRFAVSP